ncbi:tetratricopeptide repeat protein [Marispirochaeta sp.]|jgi:tetratricopeptide (TPR) repeat protein|uniref:tetratricopeptide repeat protein n=1 Tax=Marispirochaeta sp. TaxID=2038653 RepID=UPI0029C84AE0|nr:tetratricopeptide repeat protein [Marispirochaeta sp.]
MQIHSLVSKLVIFCLVLAMFLMSCSPQRRDYLDRVQALEAGDASSVSEEEVRALEENIRELVEDVERITTTTKQLGTLYKMLAVDFFDDGMFGPALDYLEKALRIYPENHTLYYYSALASARIAKTKGDPAEKRLGMLQAEYYYLEALHYKANYRDALYGLAVLYVFELGSPEQAVPHLERLVEISESHTDARFVLARAYAAIGEYDAAEQQYQRIIDLDSGSRAAEEARKLLGMLQEEQG